MPQPEERLDCAWLSEHEGLVALRYNLARKRLPRVWVGGTGRPLQQKTLSLNWPREDNDRTIVCDGQLWQDNLDFAHRHEQRHAKEALDQPTRWLPWNYEQALPPLDTG